MTRTVELLTLLDRAHEHTRSIVGRYRDWAKPPPPDEPPRIVVMGPKRLQWAEVRSAPVARASARSIWFVAPGLFRVDVRRDGVLVACGLRTGARWKYWNENDGLATGDMRTRGAPVPPLLRPPLLEPARFMAAFRLEVVGKATRAHREVVMVRAEQRRPSGTAGHVELEFDSEHGTMLRAAIFTGDDCVQINEAITIAYDQGVPHGVFTLPTQPTPARASSRGDRKSTPATSTLDS